MRSAPSRRQSVTKPRARRVCTAPTSRNASQTAAAGAATVNSLRMEAMAHARAKRAALAWRKLRPATPNSGPGPELFAARSRIAGRDNSGPGPELGRDGGERLGGHRGLGRRILQAVASRREKGDQRLLLGARAGQAHGARQEVGDARERALAVAVVAHRIPDAALLGEAAEDRQVVARLAEHAVVQRARPSPGEPREGLAAPVREARDRALEVRRRAEVLAYYRRVLAADDQACILPRPVMRVRIEVV